MNKDQFKEYIRQSVLDSLDNAIFNIKGIENCGWTDDMLPDIFPGIDKCSELLYLVNEEKIKEFLDKK